VGIEQHLVALAWIGHQPEGPACAQLQVGHLDVADVIGDGAVAAAVSVGLNLGEQVPAAAPALFGSMAVSRKGLVQGRLEGGELALDTGAFVLGYDLAGCLEPLLDRVRDSPMLFAISPRESWSRNFMRLTFPIMSMVIT
jgi:hypothetical protein